MHRKLQKQLLTNLTYSICMVCSAIGINSVESTFDKVGNHILNQYVKSQDLDYANKGV